jgi:phosphoribosylglycinamide formyltransferase-1
MRKIAIFASGSGTNAENIIKYFSNGKTARVDLVLSNRCEAFVLTRAAALNVNTLFFERNDFYSTDKVLACLHERNIDFIVLAGFLWLVPENILSSFERRIINIHPALLPVYGGKGMYGDKVHLAVLANHDKESGITIHYVNRAYDEGDIIFQAKCKIEPSDTPESLALKVHALEYKYYPKIIKDLIVKLPVSSEG